MLCGFGCDGVWAQETQQNPHASTGLTPPAKVSKSTALETIIIALKEVFALSLPYLVTYHAPITLRKLDGGERGGKGGAMRAYQKWFCATPYFLVIAMIKKDEKPSQKLLVYFFFLDSASCNLRS
jgi:hypothetical protein